MNIFKTELNIFQCIATVRYAQRDQPSSSPRHACGRPWGARLRELYKNLAISQRELDQAASDQQTAKAICAALPARGAPTPAPVVGATRPPPVSALEMSFALAAASCYRP